MPCEQPALIPWPWWRLPAAVRHRLSAVLVLPAAPKPTGYSCSTCCEAALSVAVLAIQLDYSKDSTGKHPSQLMGALSADGVLPPWLCQSVSAVPALQGLCGGNGLRPCEVGCIAPFRRLAAWVRISAVSVDPPLEQQCSAAVQASRLSPGMMPPILVGEHRTQSHGGQALGWCRRGDSNPHEVALTRS